MDIFGERTAPCLLLSPVCSTTSSSITASTFLPGSTSRGSRSRTRMATSMERNFYTFIFLSWALVILILSPSASANPINVTIAGSKLGIDSNGVSIYRKYVAREKSIEVTCKAPVPHAQMTWLRIKDDKTEENMEEVCVGKDVDLAHRLKNPPYHCSITVGGKGDVSSITLHIKRARKEGNETLKTIPDFRRYVCRAMKEGNQDGHAYLQLLETVSLDRKFSKGWRSVSVVEGNELEIYCDIHGVDKKEFDTGGTSLVWQKDGQPLQLEELKNIKKISEYGAPERGKPYRVGFLYDMAEPEHRGQYTCEVIRPFALDVESNSTKVSFTYYVRVKDKLGALWPFLGICGEVVILCTIILIYEKRRNKTELDESDTDGSPDQ